MKIDNFLFSLEMIDFVKWQHDFNFNGTTKIKVSIIQKWLFAMLNDSIALDNLENLSYIYMKSIIWVTWL